MTGGVVWAARRIAASTREAAEHLAGFFGTSEDYEKAYMPWDELMNSLMEQHPEMYEPQELVLETDLDAERQEA